MAYEQVFIGSVQIFATSINVQRAPKTVKQVTGRTLSQTSIVGSKELQKEIEITGIVTDSASNTLLQNKNALLALDNSQPHVYVDGVNDGTYFVVPGSIDFTDIGNEHFSLSRYTMSLVEE